MRKTSDGNSRNYDRVRSAIKESAARQLSRMDAMAVGVYLDILPDADLLALRERQSINVGSPDAPLLKTRSVVLLNTKYGVYQTGAAARILLESARKQGLTIS